MFLWRDLAIYSGSEDELGGHNRRRSLKDIKAALERRRMKNTHSTKLLEKVHDLRESHVPTAHVHHAPKDQISSLCPGQWPSEGKGQHRFRTSKSTATTISSSSPCYPMFPNRQYRVGRHESRTSD